MGHLEEPPAYCSSCGSPFPWTDRKVSAAIELIQEDGSLSGTELEQFRTDVQELVKDSPHVHAASSRFNKAMKKVAGPIADGARDILVDVLSETAKKAIWGK